MLPHSQLQDDLNRLKVEFLTTDVDLALTFLDTAKISADRKAAAGSVRHARQAYDYISIKRTVLLITDADRKELDARLAILRKRLEEFGEKFESGD